jgi:myo-inositol-1-phosphate synthase
MARLGVLIVGLGGAVSSTVIAGVELMIRGLVPRLGLMTENGPDMPGPLPDSFESVPLQELVFAGWDIQRTNVYQAALQHQVLPHTQLEAIRDRLEPLTPWPALFSQDHTTKLRGEHVIEAKSFRAQIEAIQAHIQEFMARHNLDRLVMMNLASTEGYLEPSKAHQNLESFDEALDRNDPCISPAMRYFYAANQLRIPYCSFAPSPLVPALFEQAHAQGNPVAGSDGKTGQTLVKTALASMFRVRRLRIHGWYSVNFLGNNDGLVLDAPSSNKAKVLSKSSVLDSIVGYHVENHQVHIHYYKPRGDAKEAWDNIDIVGFANIPMQMKLNFLCQDSILAAPLVIDLVRLLDLARRQGERGIQRQFSLFFKSPYCLEGETPVNDLFHQESMLLDWLQARTAETRVAASRAP